MTNIEKIHDEMNKKCMECNALMVRIEVTNSALKEAVDGLSGSVACLVEIIRGNGEPGINERLRVVEARELEEANKTAIWFDRVWKVLVSVGMMLLWHINR